MAAGHRRLPVLAPGGVAKESHQADDVGLAKQDLHPLPRMATLLQQDRDSRFSDRLLDGRWQISLLLLRSGDGGRTAELAARQRMLELEEHRPRVGPRLRTGTRTPATRQTAVHQHPQPTVQTLCLQD